jgi:hypothetical protein
MTLNDVNNEWYDWLVSLDIVPKKNIAKEWSNNSQASICVLTTLANNDTWYNTDDLYENGELFHYTDNGMQYRTQTAIILNSGSVATQQTLFNKTFALLMNIGLHTNDASMPKYAAIEIKQDVTLENPLYSAASMVIYIYGEHTATKQEILSLLGGE